MNCIKKMIIPPIVIFVLFSLLVSAQEFDVLLDIPMKEDDAVEKAQKGIQSSKEPEKSTLQMYPVETETGDIENRLVWNVTFGDPENKEVLVDAMKGTILSVKSTKETIPLGLLRHPIFLIIIAFVVLLIVFLIFGIIRKKTSSWPEDRDELLS